MAFPNWVKPRLNPTPAPPRNFPGTGLKVAPAAISANLPATFLDSGRCEKSSNFELMVIAAPFSPNPVPAPSAEERTRSLCRKMGDE